VKRPSRSILAHDTELLELHLGAVLLVIGLGECFQPSKAPLMGWMIAPGAFQVAAVLFGSLRLRNVTNLMLFFIAITYLVWCLWTVGLVRGSLLAYAVTGFSSGLCWFRTRMEMKHGGLP